MNRKSVQFFKSIILFGLLTFIWPALSQTDKTFSCVTPDQKDGLCIEVDRCKSIWQVLVHKDNVNNPDIANFLKQSQCGITIGSHKVCCPVEHADVQSDQETRFSSVPNRKVYYKPPNVPSNPYIKSHPNLRLLSRGSCGEYHPYRHNKSSAEFPYIGNLFFYIKDSHGVKSVQNKCIGTLITPNFVVIPAHCAVIPENLSIAYIQFNGRNYYVQQVIAHPSYNSPIYSNDIALMQLSENVERRDGTPICLPIEEDRGDEELLATSKKEGQRNFFNTKVEFLDNPDCELYFGGSSFKLTSGQYCALIKTPSTSPDSYNFDQSTLLGSIIQKYTNTNRFVFSGFTSSLIRTVQYIEEKPYVYTHVDNYLEWILDNLVPAGSASATRNSLPKSEGGKSRSEIKRLFDTDDCGAITTEDRIVGGNKTNLNEFPWMGLIKYKVGRNQFSFECGASLINSRYALTAAHCITDLPAQYSVDSVRFGEYDLTTETDCQSFDSEEELCNPPIQDIAIEELVPHPSYNNPKYSNDVGLIRLASAPDMTTFNVAPVCLPFGNIPIQKGSKYTVIGWGITETGRKSNVLLKVSVPFVELQECQRIHGRSITLGPGQSCFGGEEIRDSCKGDSGSPLQGVKLFNKRQRYVQFGVVAAGHDECGKVSGYPGIYSDVNYYMNWIIQNVRE